MEAFSSWVRRVLDGFKADPERRWGITRVAEESKTPRSALTRWRDGDWSRGIPTRASVRRFCDNLGLARDEPFGYFGWDPEGPWASAEPDPDPLPPDPKVRKLQAVLRDPDLLPDERMKYESLMDMIIRDYENRPGNGDSQATA